MSVCDFYVYLIIFALSPSPLYYACDTDTHTHTLIRTHKQVGRGATWIEKRLCRVGIILFSLAICTYTLLKRDENASRKRRYKRRRHV